VATGEKRERRKALNACRSLLPTTTQEGGKKREKKRDLSANAVGEGKTLAGLKRNRDSKKKDIRGREKGGEKGRARFIILSCRRGERKEKKGPFLRVDVFTLPDGFGKGDRSGKRKRKKEGESPASFATTLLSGRGGEEESSLLCGIAQSARKKGIKKKEGRGKGKRVLHSLYPGAS